MSENPSPTPFGSGKAREVLQEKHRMAVTDRVKQILSWYGSETPGTRTQLVRLLGSGALAGTGKLVILPVDQGFEHGPIRSFASNPPAHDPLYHFHLAIDAGRNAYSAPLGFLEAAAPAAPPPHPLPRPLRTTRSL